MAKDLKISELLVKIEDGLSGHGPQIKEIILALDADLEGDTTALYLAKGISNLLIRAKTSMKVPSIFLSSCSGNVLKKDIFSVRNFLNFPEYFL